MSTTKAALQHLFDELAAIGHTSHGMNRIAFTPPENQAFEFISQILDQHGIAHHTDGFGNLIARIHGEKNRPAVATGSHLDSVPDGGCYDGAVGVIAGLYALIELQKEALNHPLELIIFRAEESSRFGHSCMASKLMTGQADLDKWRETRGSDGKNIFDALRDNGLDPDQLDQVKINPADYKSFIECHIEQGRVLLDNHLSLGVVSAIAAPTRFLIEINGIADHSGATPMGLRHDALVAASQVVTRVNTIAQREALHGTVGTVGRMEVSPNAMNVIPGKVVMSIDIRGIDTGSIQRTTHDLLTFVSELEGVSVFITRLSEEKPVHLNNDIAELLNQSCLEESIPAMPMQSGAGHDAMYMAREIPTAMLFVPSVNGVSHNPEEFTPFDDIWNAARVLKRTMRKLAA